MKNTVLCIQFSIIVLMVLIFSSRSFAQIENCNLNGFVTYTQGGWGSPSNSGPGKIRDNYFNSVFPGGLIIGSNYKLTLTSATAVKNFLPEGGTAGAFNQNYTNPTSTSAGVLGGQIVALSMNVYYSAAGYLGTNPLPLGSLVFVSGPFAGKTVYQFLAIANQAIGGVNTGYSFSDINISGGKDFFYRLKQIDTDGKFTLTDSIQISLQDIRFTLSQNFPNPFNPATVIHFSIPDDENVNLTIYDVLGNEVSTLLNEVMKAGVHSVYFDASSAAGGLASGIYFYKLRAGHFIEVKKMTLIK